MKQWARSKFGMEYIKAICYHPAYLTSMQNTSCEMPVWINHKLESQLLKKYQQPQISRWYYSNGRQWRGTKEPLDEDERGEWKIGLKLNIKKKKKNLNIMTSSPITSWQIEGENVETLTDFIFLVSKIIADGDCSYAFKRCLLLEEKLWPT